MLHEVLLALSGHPSPLFGDRESGNYNTQDEDFPLLSPPERALLRSIGRLSGLHRRLKKHLESVSSSHKSIICRAVATSIQHTHLQRFQQRILDVEGRILKKDASLVGAYEIVPLASVVGEFDDWHRLMAWYWEVACFISPPKDPHRNSGPRNTASCTSARLIDKLRVESQTGFPEIETAATELAKVADTAWLRQLASWVIHGKLPAFGAQDFFIQHGSTQDATFRQDKDLLPGFVNSATASSILYIGKSLHQVHHHTRQTKNVSFMLSDAKSDQSDLASTHLQQLSALAMPIVSAQFSRTIADLRLSLSQNVLQHLLPTHVTLEVLNCMRQVFLLGRGEFAVALINEADKRMQSRQRSMGRLLQQDPVKALQDLSIKDAELHQALQQVWRAVSREDGEDEDQTLEYAQKHVSLTTTQKASSRPSTSEAEASATAPVMATTAFNNLLFPTPTDLSLTISSPLDLFLSTRDVTTYSTINSYLLGIRRGHQRLSDLWRRSPARRNKPSSSGADVRSRRTKRETAQRKVWATCSAAIFMLSETAAFFENEIIKDSCAHFLSWVKVPPPSDAFEYSRSAEQGEVPTRAGQRDPETLALGHRAFLAALTYSLLLTDIAYTRELRSLLGNVDNLIAFFVRLFDIHQKLDLEQQSGQESAHIVEEERRINLELDRARKRVDSDLRAVVNRLRHINAERIGSLRYLQLRPGDAGDFEPWKGGGVDRLLMKLEFARMVDSGKSAV